MTLDRTRKLVLSCLLAGTLAACGTAPAREMNESEGAPPATVVAQAAAATATLAPSIAASVTATPAPAEPTATATATATSTRAPRPTSSPTVTTVATEEEPAAVPDAAALDIRLFQFDPAMISVPLGSTVMWTNHDDIPHSASSGSAGEPDGRFDTGFFEQGESRQITFSEAGTYSYFCLRHPSMVATIVVEGP